MINRTIINVEFLRNLLLLLIGLKLSGFIAWNWIFVLMPFWLPLSAVLFSLWYLARKEKREEEKRKESRKW